MKATDIMIGDWVSWCGNNLKVLGTGTEDTYFGLDAICDIVPNEEVEPIPLTEDILKANGFEEHEHELTKRRSFNEMKYYHVNFFVTSDNVFILDIEAANDRGTMSRTHIVPKYVHELQHALRLCGLNELADNFKLKSMEEQQ